LVLSGAGGIEGGAGGGVIGLDGQDLLVLGDGLIEAPLVLQQRGEVVAGDYLPGLETQDFQKRRPGLLNPAEFLHPDAEVAPGVNMTRIDIQGPLVQRNGFGVPSLCVRDMRWTFPAALPDDRLQPSIPAGVKAMVAGADARGDFDSVFGYLNTARPQSRSLMEGPVDGNASFNASRYRCY
jgi:hypothetical protein